MDESEYETLKEQVNFGIADTYEKHYESKLERVKGYYRKSSRTKFV